MDRRRGKVLEIQLDTAAATYSGGDQVGVIKELVNAVEDCGAHATITSVTVFDDAQQDSQLDLFFFDSLPTVVSDDQDTSNISKADLFDKCLGFVSVLSANYVNLNGVAIVTVSNIKLKVRAAAKLKSIWVYVITRDTPTYASTTDLYLRVGLDQD